MYALVFASRFTKSFRRLCKSGKFPLQKFEQALAHLREGEALPVSYQDHQLKGELSVQREFHLSYDLLVQYKRNEEKRIITISKIGTHAELFGG